MEVDSSDTTRWLNHSRDAEMREADADAREAEADAREAEADQRDRHLDARERVLDRWEREIAARAAAMHGLDEAEEAAREIARAHRSRDRDLRRERADERREAAIDREVRRTERADVVRSAPDAAPASDRDADDYARLARASNAAAPLDELVDLILVTAVATVPGCEAATMTLSTAGELRTAASTATWAADLDVLQIEAGEGPVIAAAGGAMVITDDIADDPRWPDLGRFASAQARRGLMCFGLVDGEAGTGVLTLYAGLDESFDEAAVRVGDVLAAHASVTLGRTLDRAMFEAKEAAWQRALASRDAIGQAKGIVMEQRTVSADDAFLVLREASQRLNVKLRDVAEHVVEHRRLPDA